MFFRHRFARIFSPCSQLRTCWRPPRAVSSTGKKVNTALDNPTNFFTAQGLDNRASDINNLLDGIGNGVQVLQAANTGITSLQKLVDTAKSVANQALQTQVGYSTAPTSPPAPSPATALRSMVPTSAASAPWSTRP